MLYSLIGHGRITRAKARAKVVESTARNIGKSMTRTTREGKVTGTNSRGKALNALPQKNRPTITTKSGTLRSPAQDGKKPKDTKVKLSSVPKRTDAQKSIITHGKGTDSGN